MPRTHAELVRFARQMRSEPTDAERKLWTLLSRVRPRFTRQLPIGAHIADLACRSARVVVEADGSQHAESGEDERRTQALEAAGWRVLRYWNSEALRDPASVVEAILAEAERRLPPGVTFEFVEGRTRARQAS